MRKFFKVALAATALAGLSACTTGMPSKVSRYHQMPATTGESFVVVAQDPAKQGTLEFQRFGEMVAAEMASQGYAPASSIEDATMVVQLDYGVDEGRERIVQDPFYDRYGWNSYWGDPFYRRGYVRPVYYRDRYGNVRRTYVRLGFGYGSRYGYYRGWDDPFWFASGRNRIRSYTEYRSDLDIDIVRKDGGPMLFEGTAKARSRTDDLGTLVPNLVTAMFTDFPGRSGETIKITVKPENEE
ncbi:DUF4136 domain-containing protein [Sphingomicrobium clamense]|uniref:DUF4136 domain-containing protein n=1 Tax=Sphingomicrobium clamense TaxID=2851013 RepID=A0ABS6V5Q8_9SPHN|nr:DUF4136 domain-containing protein [Sphingomicrobium sp. B8]MBW0144873.1 DUF4136 domain-containing protein [Sphingomicrobium sp. B8]